MDIQTGYRTHSICCMPILNRDNVVIGVAQIINKKTGTHEFTSKDINVSSPIFLDYTCFSKCIFQVFRNYLTFCGLSLSNAQIFELSIQEFKKNQVSLITLLFNVVLTTSKQRAGKKRKKFYSKVLLIHARARVHASS